jgi:DNA invertase Pin-like site-specific DNA recombinase
MKTTTAAAAGKRRKAFSYLRFSSPQQLGGDSRRRQTEAAADWCRRNHVELVRRFEDLGISAYRGQNAQTGALSQFLKLVRAGKIEKGSILLVESLDRLSRADVLVALEMFLGIIRSGVGVLTLADERLYDEEKLNGNVSELIVSLSVMSRANEESKTKSMRIAASWDAKRKRLAKEKMTANCPSWLRLTKDRQRFEPLPEKVAIIKKVFDLARRGLGLFRLRRALVAEGVPGIGRSGKWSFTNLHHLLSNRGLLGEYRPTARGEYLDPIQGYYPRVIAPSLFASVQAVRHARPNFKGRATGLNPFAKLAFSVDGSGLQYVSRRFRDKKYEYLVSAKSVRGESSEFRTWPLDDFLAAFLFLTKKASLSKPPQPRAEDDALAKVKLELADTEAQIGRCAQFVAEGTSPAVQAKLRQLEQRKVELQQQVRDIECKAVAAPVRVDAVNWHDRKALRENLLSTVEKIIVDPSKRAFEARFLDGRKYTYREVITKERGVEIFYGAPDGEAQQLFREAKQRMVGFQTRWQAREQAKSKSAGKAKAK